MYLWQGGEEGHGIGKVSVFGITPTEFTVVLMTVCQLFADVDRQCREW